MDATRNVEEDGKKWEGGSLEGGAGHAQGGELVPSSLCHSVCGTLPQEVPQPSPLGTGSPGCSATSDGSRVSPLAFQEPQTQPSSPAGLTHSHTISTNSLRTS